MRSYVELYDIVAAILIGRENSAIGIKLTEWIRLKLIVAEVIARQDGMNVGAGQHRLAPDEAELVRDVFWDMFRQGFITLGLNDHNAEWPHFRLSHFGQQTLKSGKPFHFTDARSYIELVKQNVPSLDDTTSMYLDEAVRSFYAGCFLAASVMLGVASENRFLSFLESVKASPTHAAIFQKVDEDPPILSKIKKFFFLL